MRIWHSLRGYVIIRIEGVYLERFLNLCMAERIGIWGVGRKSRTVMTARVGVKDFPRLRSVVRRTGCRVSITRRRGGLFLFTRFRFRKFLLGGVAVAAAVVFLLSSYVWSIGIIGVSGTEHASYMRQLESQGVHIGMFKSALDLRRIEESLVINNEDVVWACARLSGVRLTIEVVKGEQAPELVDTQTPTRVIATKDAVVDSMVILEGRRMVQNGQTVEKGQELIGGVIEYEDMPQRYVHARGKVYGRVWYSKKVSLPLNTVTATDTGRTLTVRYLRLGGWTIPIDPEDVPYQHARTETRDYELIGEGLFVPARVEAVLYIEQDVQQVPADMEALKASAQLKAWEAVKQELPASALIENRDYVFSVVSGSLVCEARVETLEQIGKVVKLNAP